MRDDKLIEAMEALDYAANALFEALIAVGSGQIAHVYMGACPDEVDGHGRRDPECPACRVLWQAAEHIALQKQEGWVKCGERLPEESDGAHVLIFNPFALPDQGSAYRIAPTSQRRLIRAAEGCYWCPLPAAPQPEEAP